MIPLAWYAIGTLACLAGFALVWVGQTANRGHAACERLARRAVRGVEKKPGLEVSTTALSTDHASDVLRATYAPMLGRERIDHR